MAAYTSSPTRWATVRYTTMRDSTSQSWSEELPWSLAYQSFSVKHEPRCVAAGSWGSRWTTPSTEAQFGLAGEAGDLSTAGAPRWKQRALYDSMKDGLAVAGVVKLARLSVHDQVGTVTLGSILHGFETCDFAALKEHVEGRVFKA